MLSWAALNVVAWSVGFQPLATTKGERGTGLGLSGSKSIIESAGGRIRFETVEGQGTTFVIWLPTSSTRSDHSNVERSNLAVTTG